MERFLLFFQIVFWVVIGGIALYRGEPLPSANVLSVAVAFFWLYQIKKNK